MSSIMRRRRGLKSAISILLSEGGGLQHPHPLSQEAIYATLPLTPRQRLRSIQFRQSIAKICQSSARLHYLFVCDDLLIHLLIIPSKISTLHGVVLEKCF